MFRLRWFAAALAVVSAAGVFAIGAAAWADQRGSNCPDAHVVNGSTVRLPREPGGTDATAWRIGMFRAAGCRAWLRLHRHEDPTQRGRAEGR